MIAISVKERAATHSKGEEVVALAPPSGNTVVSVAAVRVLSASPAERHAMIAEVAYYIAEQRGFQPGHELEDWLCAEREVSGKVA
jgi:hypothetical protein